MDEIQHKATNIICPPSPPLDHLQRLMITSLNGWDGAKAEPTISFQINIRLLGHALVGPLLRLGGGNNRADLEKERHGDIFQKWVKYFWVRRLKFFDFPVRNPRKFKIQLQKSCLLKTQILISRNLIRFLPFSLIHLIVPCFLSSVFVSLAAANHVVSLCVHPESGVSPCCF